MQGAGDVSVEDILASIKRVIARDARPPVAVPIAGQPPAPLREPIEPSDADEAGEVLALAEDGAASDTPAEALTGPDAAAAARAAFAGLQSLADGGGPLDRQVQQMLRPMLAQWLDAHLPAIVERLVRAEIARITGTNG